MRYVMKQKLFSFGEDFYIQDADGKDVFFVDGKAFSFGDQLSFQDLAGNELVSIRQRVLSWGPTYEVYWKGALSWRRRARKRSFAESTAPSPDRPLVR